MTFMHKLAKYSALVVVGSWASLSMAAGPDGHEHLNPPGLYDSTVHGYSQVVVVKAAERTIYVAGQGGENAKGEYSSDFAEQVDQALSNLQTALKAAGTDVDNIVQMSVFIVDHSMERLGIFEKAMLKMLDGRDGPASTLVPVPALAIPAMQFEVNAVAVAGS